MVFYLALPLTINALIKQFFLQGAFAIIIFKETSSRQAALKQGRHTLNGSPLIVKPKQLKPIRQKQQKKGPGIVGPVRKDEPIKPELAAMLNKCADVSDTLLRTIKFVVICVFNVFRMEAFNGPCHFKTYIQNGWTINVKFSLKCKYLVLQSLYVIIVHFSWKIK